MGAVDAVRLEPLTGRRLGDVAALITDADVLRFTRVPEPAPADFARTCAGGSS
jgi:hypothetical protein